MSTSTPMLGGRGTPYRDKKRYAWLLSVIAPFAGPLGPFLYLQTQQSLWLWFALLVFYIVIPLLDGLLGEDKSNPPEAAVAGLEADPYYRRITHAVVPSLWFGFIFNVIFLATEPLAWYDWLATVIVTGSLLGFGLNLGHELGHKRDWLDRKLALLTLALGGYGHFNIEHNRGHHRHVATPDDPASSRMGETIYRFVLREMPGGFSRAWTLEAESLELRGKSRWHLDNEILQAGLVTTALYATLIVLFGWAMVPVLLLTAFWGAFQLTSANYIEHYGLLRKQLADGRFERCQPHHSWNSNHIVSNLVLFHLQRHSDHHAHPGRHYQSLRNFPDLPTLPVGYFGMFLLAYVPPLWFRVMDRRLVDAVGNDAGRINFLPTRKAQLIRRHALSGAA